MKRALRYIFLLWLSGIPGLYAQTPDSLFSAANRLYDQARYAEALDAYNRILQSGYESPELYLNMGNAAYRANRKGQAVYYYEKALQLDPHLDAARNNLALTRRNLIDRFTPLPEGFFHRLYKGYTGMLDLLTWGWISLTAIWLAFFFAVAYLLVQTPTRKRLFFTLALLMLTVWFLAYAGYYGARHRAAIPHGIVQPEETARYTEPSLAAETDGKIHEGAKVRILKREKDWLQVQTVDGNTFWIPANDVWPLEYSAQN